MTNSETLEQRVELHEVGHRFGDRDYLFTGLSHHFVPTQPYAITGPSGSGKSTLLAILAGMLQPAQGEVATNLKGRTVAVLQSPIGIPTRSVQAHVIYPLLARGYTRTLAHDEARGVLERFGLLHIADARYASISGGEAQRLMLARATCANPGLLLVDEPTAQLDRVAAAHVNGVLGEVARGDSIVIVATHDDQTIEACGAQINLGDYAPQSQTHAV